MAIHLSIDPSARPDARRRAPDDPFRVLILADLLGEADAGPLEQRRILRLDIDRFDTLFSGLAPRLTLADGETVEFTGLDDFHPDHLYRSLRSLTPLRELRRRLRDPQQADAAIAELAGKHPSASSGGPDPSDADTTAADTADESSAFEQLLGGRPMGRRSTQSPAGLDRLLKDIVAPHVIDGADPGPYLQALDLELAERLRAILHQPGFRHLESHWRGLWWLLCELPDTPELQLHLLPVSRAELAGDLLSNPTDPSASALHRLLRESASAAPDSAPWALLAGLFGFGASADDLRLLAALGVLAASNGAPLLAAAEPALAGCRDATELAHPENWQPLDGDLETRWQALRQSAVAGHISLCLPRLLLRQPYGRRSDPLDSFEFEEIPAPPQPELLLWASPTLGGLLALTRGFVEAGWNLDPTDPVDLEDLPAWYYDVDGETRLQPCAEVLLGERAVAALAGRGLSPLLSYRNRNAVRVPGLLALSGESPVGAWG